MVVTVKALAPQPIRLSECAARWHPDTGWIDADLDPEAVIALKALGREHD